MAVRTAVNGCTVNPCLLTHLNLPMVEHKQARPQRVMFTVSIVNIYITTFISSLEVGYMSSEAFNSYLKIILNSSSAEYGELLDHIFNDNSLNETEQGELQNLINRNLASLYSKYNVRVINKVTGLEEYPPQTDADDFGGTCTFKGTEMLYGIKWNVYEPSDHFLSPVPRKWYYNMHISNLLTELFLDVVPGRFRNYFHVPPWLLGTFQAPGTRYISLTEIVNTAIFGGLIPGWDYLIERGIPKEFVRALEVASPDYPQ